METNKIIKIEGVLSIVGAVGLLIWWFLMPIFLPIADSENNFKLLILDNNWIAINIVGLISALQLTLGFPGFYLKKQEKFNQIGFYGLIIAMIGLILFTSIQYYETLLWPAAAKINPELLQVKGALVSGDLGVVIGLIISGAFLGIGYIVFCISALKTKSFPKIPLWFMILGAPIFGIGIAFPIRTIGLILLCIGTIWLSRSIRKQ
jgi:hypothetical protein